MKTDSGRFISVVIPAYNEEEYLASCLEALQEQLYEGDEVIVVDNNSTDRTAVIARRHSGVRMLQEKFQGQVFAQATGFDAAKHTILARIDADTVVEPGWRAKIDRNTARHDVFTGPGVAYDLVSRAIPTAFMRFWTFKSNRFISGHYPLWGSNFVMTKQVWRTCKDQMAYRTDLWEDFELSILMHKNDIAIHYDPDFTVGYSLRTLKGLSLARTIAYQTRAPRTYWHQQSRFVGVLSFVERWMMGLLVLVWYPFEMVRQARSARAIRTID